MNSGEFTRPGRRRPLARWAGWSSVIRDVGDAHISEKARSRTDGAQEEGGCGFVSGNQCLSILGCCGSWKECGREHLAVGWKGMSGGWAHYGM